MRTLKTTFLIIVILVLSSIISRFVDPVQAERRTKIGTEFSAYFSI